MITEDYVNFEIAKLLKERGFDWNCESKRFYPEPDYDQESPDGVCAPTLQMGMKWLREVHRLHVEVVPKPFSFEHQDIQDGWGCEVMHLSDLSYDSDYEFFQKKYSTYEQACEAAIKYCLENLI